MPLAGLALDHLVLAARTLEEGAHWLEERTGVPTVPGGRHACMGTHNRLMSLGEDAYLEVIAIDPEAPEPARPRWFALDTEPMRSRLAQGPALVHWVARTAGLDAAREVAPGEVGEILALSRGAYRWRIGVPADGSLPGGGAFPTLIQWEGGRHPAQDLQPAGCALESLHVRAPDWQEIGATVARLGLGTSGPVHFAPAEAVGLSAILRTPRGFVILPESSRKMRA